MTTYEVTLRTDTVLLVEKVTAKDIVEAYSKATAIAKAQKWILLSVKMSS